MIPPSFGDEINRTTCCCVLLQSSQRAKKHFLA
jgi:hypothetical protein